MVTFQSFWLFNAVIVTFLCKSCFGVVSLSLFRSSKTNPTSQIPEYEICCIFYSSNTVRT